MGSSKFWQPWCHVWLHVLPLDVETRQAMQQLHNHPCFWLSLALKVSLILLALPKTQQDWFLPFLTQTLPSFTLDPWSNYLAAGGTILAFPYGIVMYLAYAPLTWLGLLVDQGFSIEWGAKVGFGLTSLVLDYLILISIALLARYYSTLLLLLAYWCSPIVLYITYWHGQVDILPIALLVTGICLLQWGHPIPAGLLLGLATSSKFSMLVAIPFVLVYVYRNTRLQTSWWQIGGIALIAASVTFLPFLQSPGFVQMGLESREISRLYTVSLSYGDNLNLFLLPLGYILVLYFAYRIERITLDLFLILIGVAFLVLLLLLPPASGWFMWVMPFVAFYQIRARRSYLWLTFPFFVLYLSYSLLYSTGASLPLFGLDWSLPLATAIGLQASQFQSILFTALHASGLLVGANMYIFGIHRNNYYQASRKALSVGITGAASPGRDQFVDSLKALVGSHTVIHLNGDDYYKGDHYHPMWLARSRLNPNAYNLNRLTQDVQALSDRRMSQPVLTGRTGYRSGVRTNNLILVSGLHTLHLKRLRESLDLKIFLDLDETLRQFWQMQTALQADAPPPSTTITTTQQTSDFAQFIRPQIPFADLILKLSPVSQFELTDPLRTPKLKLLVRMDNGFFHDDLVRHLIALCGMQVDIEQSESLDFINVSIEGDASSEDIAQLARLLIPNLEDLVVRTPDWQKDYLGLMQVIFLAHISDILHRQRP